MLFRVVNDDPHHFATRPEHELPADDTNDSAGGRYRITTHVDATNRKRKNA